MSEASSMLRTTRDIRLSSVQAVRTDSLLHIVCAMCGRRARARQMESAHMRASASASHRQAT